MSAAPKTPVTPPTWHPSIPAPVECRRRVDQLTPRQRQYVELLAAGWQMPEIAVELGVAVKTVNYMLNKTFEVLEVRPSGRAVALFRRAEEAPSSGVVPIRRRSDFGTRRNQDQKRRAS